MRIVLEGGVAIEVEPGEEHQAAELIRALQGNQGAETPQPPRVRGQRLTDTEIRQIGHLHEGGLGVNAIAEHLGVGRSTVHRYLAQIEKPTASTRVHLPPEENQQ